MAHSNGKVRNGIGPEPSQISDTALQAVAGGYKIAIHRTSQAVQITLTSVDEYASIELYDSLVRSMRKGSLRLELKSSRS